MLPFLKLHLTIERWKFNEEFEVYVSTLGNVKDTKKELLPQRTCNKYKIVKLPNKTNIFVHRLVLLTFKPTSDALEMTVDHIDSNPRNNRLSNLKWMTAENNNALGLLNTKNIKYSNQLKLVFTSKTGEKIYFRSAETASNALNKMTGKRITYLKDGIFKSLAGEPSEVDRLGRFQMEVIDFI